MKPKIVRITTFLEIIGEGVHHASVAAKNGAPTAPHWELECEVEATVSPGCKATRLDPPEPPEIEYERVVIIRAYRYDLPKVNGKTAEWQLQFPLPGTGLEFTPGQFEFMAQLINPGFEMADLDPEIYEAATDAAEAAYEDEMERRAEARREDQVHG